MTRLCINIIKEIFVTSISNIERPWPLFGWSYVWKANTSYLEWHVVNQQQWSRWRWHRCQHVASRRGRAVIFVIIIRSTAHKDSLASRNRAIISTFIPCEIAGRFLPSLNVNHACGIMPVCLSHMRETETLFNLTRLF